MTSEEILALEGLELRKAVAKAVYRRMHYCEPPAEWDAHSCAHFESDIAAAWPLLEEIRDSYRIKGGKAAVVVSLYGDGSYRVEIGRMSYDLDGIYVIGAELEPIICRAYLLAKAVSE